MKATTEYIRRLLEENRRINREAQFQQRRLQDLDIESRYQEPQEMPDWAKAIRAADNDIRSV